MKVRAYLKNYRMSPRKVRLLSTLVRGLTVAEADAQLSQSVKGSSEQMQKLLLSAVANAENNFGLSRENLYVFEMRVDAGPTMKRWLPRAFGRATEIHKRTSNITIVLDELVEGKDRKDLKALEEEKKSKAKEVVKTDVNKKKTPKTQSGGGGTKVKKSGGFSKKMFQRKSA